MNWQHFSTLLWVRWRVRVNQLGRRGRADRILNYLGAGLGVLVSIVGFGLAFLIGRETLSNASPPVVIVVCDLWILGFLGSWLLGVLADLQRSELLSVDRLLHLPTTLTEVFVFNFLGSLLSLTAVVFVPPLVGLLLAAVVAKGAGLLATLPLLAGFVVAIAAVTYQFRSWLAIVMTNKRHRRAIVVATTCVVAVLAQVPNLLHMSYRSRSSEAEQTRLKELERQYDAHELTPEEYSRELTETAAGPKVSQLLSRYQTTLEWANLIVPMGWLAYGAQAAWLGQPWLAGAFAAGLFAIAALSLRRSYRSTLRYLTGIGQPKPSGFASVAVREAKPLSNWVTWSLPLVPEQVAAVACSTFRSLTRAEVKLVLLGPLIMCLVFASMLLSRPPNGKMPPALISLLPVSVLGLAVAMPVVHLAQNILAFDRSGFRAYVLSGIPRSQLLFGKNLALAPFVFVWSTVLLAVVQFVWPAPVTHFAAILLEVPVLHVLLCLLGNYAAILWPVNQAAGSLRPARPSSLKVIFQILWVMVTFAILSVVGLLPIGIELILDELGLLPRYLPVALVLSMVECLLTAGLYRVLIRRQGELLQARECRILEIISERGE